MSSTNAREKKRVERGEKRYMRALPAKQLLADKGPDLVCDNATWPNDAARLEVLQFGILNIDKPFVIDAWRSNSLPTSKHATEALSKLTRTTDCKTDAPNQSRLVPKCRDGLVEAHPGQDQLLSGTTPDGALAYIRIRELDPLTRDLEAFTFPMRVARLDDLSPEAVIDLLLPEEKHKNERKMAISAQKPLKTNQKTPRLGRF